jgi:hypothetical protein
MITPGIQVVALKYDVSLDMVSSLLIGFLAFWIGFTTFFTASGANIWGKRPFFVISTGLLLCTNIWGFFSTVRDLGLGHMALQLTNFSLSLR